MHIHCDDFIQGLSEIEVRTMDDVMMVMEEGELNRTVADTKMNTNRYIKHVMFKSSSIIPLLQLSLTPSSNAACGRL